MSHIDDYLREISQEYNSGRAREHTYRPALKNLLQKINPSVLAINEPSREACGAPDFIIMDEKNIPRWYIEAKDIVSNILDDKKNQSQIEKYFDGELGYNFIHTDNIEFRFYRNKELVETVKIAEIINGKIVSKPENFEKLEMLLQNFLSFKTQTITSSKKLAEIMAGKARMIKRVIYMTLLNSTDTQTEVHNQFKVFKDVLVHDLDETSFADIYAQTIVYGLFTARLHDPTLPTFDRDEAARLLPKSNPFLKKFFQSLRDDLDPRIEWIVDDLVEVFLASDVKTLLTDYGKTTARNDPIIHFYEDFLSLYDRNLRKAKWVYYTPEPVVNFIIRWVDEILKSEFGLADWLADTSKTKIQVDQPNSKGKIIQVDREVHKVQVLDPATWTGTFLNSIVKYIYETRFTGMTWIWNSYVTDNLIPRLHGFEYMMASYAMAHLKLDLTLTETGYRQDDKNPQRLGIYLTNSLEEEYENTGEIWSSQLAHESNEASYIKRDTPVMCIVGNPPYSVSSSNKSEWILKMIQDYKKNLNERKINLDDDYIKFIRLAQYYIDRNGEWIIGYISNNSYLDGITHREMRKNLLTSFDSIYIYDLHGNARKKETTPEWWVDNNVFDIMAGVSIIFAVKTGKKKKWELWKLYHFDSYGKRQEKYDRLDETSLANIPWTKLQTPEPYYFFVPKDFGAEEKYMKGFSVNEIFKEFNSWIQTKNDKLSVQFDNETLKKVVLDFQELEVIDLKQKYKLNDTSGWNIQDSKNDLLENNIEYSDILYRPFDSRKTLFTGKSGWFIWRPRTKSFKNMLRENVWFVTTKQLSTFEFQHILISKSYIESGAISVQTKEWWYFFPLYLYPEQPQESLMYSGSSSEWRMTKVPNFNSEIIAEIEKKLGLKMSPDSGESGLVGKFTPEDILDYIYAVLHSRSYRETYKEFLKIDFPRVPFDVSAEIFWQMVTLGRELRSWHLLENEKLIPQNFITTYPIDGDNLVEKVKYIPDNLRHPELVSGSMDAEIHSEWRETGSVFINDTQYFSGVPANVWEFFIGGYQPAQKWLKDRKGRNLGYEDIIHYGKIILTLSETIRIMDQIESVFQV